MSPIDLISVEMGSAGPLLAEDGWPGPDIHSKPPPQVAPSVFKQVPPIALLKGHSHQWKATVLVPLLGNLSISIVGLNLFPLRWERGTWSVAQTSLIDLAPLSSIISF